MATSTNESAMSTPTFSGTANSLRHVRSRTQSISSDRPSTIGFNMMTPPQSVSPVAAFIAASAGSQIVTNDLDSNTQKWYDEMGIEPSTETALVSDPALQLANNFVDHLLFNIIAIAKSTTLAALRPAVTDVLKPKLAKDAINQAEEELQEYLGGGEVEDLVRSAGIPESARDWDVELAWKRTRLRCMVYSSLGDMEEEDEDYYMEQEHLIGDSEDESELVSPAVAIFMTSILEFVGEQVLVVAGQAAFNRLRSKYEKELKEDVPSAGPQGLVSDRIVVEELDMERVALDRTLGRLWRAWKKRIRPPHELNSHARYLSRSANHSRQGSLIAEAVNSMSTSTDTIHEPQEPPSEQKETPQESVKDEKHPAAIPLPMSNNDVAEIEVPGLVSYSDDEKEDTLRPTRAAPRPKSMMLFSTTAMKDTPASNLAQPHTPITPTRPRANSLPSPTVSPFDFPIPPTSRPVSFEPVVTQAPAEEKHDQSTPAEVDVPANYHSSKKMNVPQLATALAAATRLDAADSPVSPKSHATTSVPRVAPAPLTQDDAHHTESEAEDSTEEPQIMTSSRVSVGGRSTPSTISESGRAASVGPARSNSVHSVRVIDVQGRRSPSVRSIDPAEYQYTGPSHSGENSISTPPIIEEGVPEPISPKVVNRNAVIMPPPRRRPEMNAAANQYESRGANGDRLVSPTVVPVPRSTPSPARTDRQDPSRSGGSWMDLDDNQEMPRKFSSSSQSRHPTLPTLPERSTSKQNYAQSPTMRTSSFDRSQNGQRTPESPRHPIRPVQGDSPTSVASSKLRAVRSSEDSNFNRPQDVARNFEALLQNDQTLQYTLTPEHMRDNANQLQQNEPPVVPSKSRRSSETKRADRSRSSSVQRNASPAMGSGPLSSNPPNFQSNTRLAGPVPRAPPAPMATHSRFGSASSKVRDARIPQDSTQDFADFIRSTGPQGGRTMESRQAPNVLHKRDISSPTSIAATPTITNATAPNTAKRRGSVMNRLRLQARDAAVNPSHDSSDLIDFIRSGPPGPNGNGHRIPRTVAPFRTTMDSDQMQMSGAAGGRAVDASIHDVRISQASTNVTESSTNSHSALLSKAGRPGQYSDNFDDDSGMMPQRKQRRVRDPYAIDFSDDEDELEEIMEKPKPKPRARQEESLADFLNNYEPPPDPTPPQPFIISHNLPKKKSAPALIARLRSGSTQSNGSILKHGFNISDTRSLRSQAGQRGGHTPIVPNYPPGVGASTTTLPIPNLNSNSRMGSSTRGRVPMKRFEPRDATSSGTRTSDLANFLRDSAPPPSPSATLPVPEPIMEEKSSGGLRGMFERRKKSVF